MFTNRKLVLHSLLIQFFLGGAFGCMCEPQHLQRSFCGSDFVFAGNFLAETPSQRGYWVNFIFNLDSIYRMTTRTFFLTSNKQVIQMSRLCRIFSPNVNEKFIIFANSIKGNEFKSGLCYGNTLYLSLTKSQQIGLKENYKKGCDCLNETDEYGYGPNCYYDYSFVMKRNGSCEWVQTNELKRCLLKHPQGHYPIPTNVFP